MVTMMTFIYPSISTIILFGDDQFNKTTFLRNRTEHILKNSSNTWSIFTIRGKTVKKYHTLTLEPLIIHIYGVIWQARLSKSYHPHQKDNRDSMVVTLSLLCHHMNPVCAVMCFTVHVSPPWNLDCENPKPECLHPNHTDNEKAEIYWERDWEPSWLDNGWKK